MVEDNKLMSLVKSLSLEELHEVLARGFCDHCDALLQNRIHSILQGKINNEKSLESSIATPRRNSSISSRSVTTPPEVANGLSEKEKEKERMSQVKRKKDFVHIERVNGKQINVVQGLELHTGVFNAEEQKEIVNFVYDLQHKGQSGQLRERTYTEPTKWMRGKGRVTIQFGCCYNYAEDRKGNPPGILRAEEVDPLPPRFKDMIKRLVNCRISITFRKMDESKLPYNYRPDPDLVFNTSVKTPFLPRQLQQNPNNSSPWSRNGSVTGESSSGKLSFEKDDFPALGSFTSSKHKRAK